MEAVEVVIVDELHEHSVKVLLVDDDHVIKALLSDRANEPLGDGICPRCPKRCPDASETQLG
jgi:hypothetical protein